MNERITRDKKKTLVKLIAVAALVVAVVAILGFQGVDVRLQIDRGLEVLRAAGPWTFFCAMALLPAVGCPISVFTLPAGSVFAPVMGMPWVLVCVCLAIAVNLVITYWLARYLLRPWLIKLCGWLGYTLPQVSEEDWRGLVVVVRATPGPPYVLQSYLLGLADIPFATYFSISWIISSLYSCAFVIFGDALLHGRGKMILIAVGLLVGLTVAVKLLRRHYSRKKKGSDETTI